MIWDALYIGKVIYNACKNISGVSLRVYPLRIPQAVSLLTDPALSYYIISVTPEDTKDSRSLCDTVVFQVSIFGSTYTLTTSIAQGVRDALDGLNGETSDISVDYMRFEGWADDYEDDTKLFSKHMEFSCRVKNDASTGTGYLTFDVSSIVTALNLTDDYTWTSIIPAGYMLESVIAEESTGETGQLSCGTGAGITDVFQSQAVTGGGLTVIEVNKIFSTSSATTIYINHAGSGDDWNGMTLSVYGVLRKIN
jgi:hypothetical protein